MTFTTTHTIPFTIGSTDWQAEIECDGTGYTLQSVSMDVAGKAMGCIEAGDLSFHGGLVDEGIGPDGWRVVKWHSFYQIIRDLMRTRLSDIIARHADEKGQNAIDTQADHYRERRE